MGTSGVAIGGAAKGRAVLRAAETAFARAVGVELDEVEQASAERWAVFRYDGGAAGDDPR